MSKTTKVLESKPVGLDPRLGGAGRQANTALLSVIAYARDEARRSESDFVAFCLDIAFAAARSDLQTRLLSMDGLRLPFPRLAHPPGDSSESESSEQLH